MKKRTGKMISLSLAVAMAMTAAPVTALANENTQSSVIEASELTPVQGTGETGTDTTTVGTKEEVEPATVVAASVVYEALIAGDVEETKEAVPLGKATTYEVDSQTSLENAINKAEYGDTIKLTDSFIVTNKDKNISSENALFTLPAGVTLNGNNQIITAAPDWVKTAKNHIVGIVNAKDTKICNLTIVGNEKTKHGINVFGNNASMDIENVTVKDCGTAGIVVNGATVTATDITTENNAWGAINVDKAGTFILKGDCNIAEANKVWSENTSNATIDVDVDDWVTMKTTDGDDNKTYYTDLEDVNEVLKGITAKDEGENNYGNATITLNGNVTVSNDAVKGSYGAAAVALPDNVTLNGAGYTISADDNWESENTNHILGVTNGTVVIENVTIVGNAKTKSGIVAWQGAGSKVNLTLTGVEIQNCGNAALQVNSATVTATNLKTSGNSWGAVNVDKASRNTNDIPSFTLSGDKSELSESTKVWTEIKGSVDSIINDETTGKVLGTPMIDSNGTTYYGYAVAQIGDTKYPTLAEALNHVAEGGTITLLADATVNSAIVINAADVTIDGENHAINVIADIADNLITVKGNDFTLQDVTINGNANVAKSAVHFYNTTGGNVTGATINGGGYTSILVNGAEVTVKDSILNPDNGAYANIEYGVGQNVTTVPKVVVENVTADTDCYLVYADQNTIDRIQQNHPKLDANAIDKDYVIGANLQVANAAVATYTITFDLQGGTLADGENKATTNKHGKLDTLPTPERSRYRFDGWFTDDGTEVTTNTVFSEDTAIHAKWTRTSSGGSHKFDNYITVITPKNGEVSVSDDWAYEDDKITLTITPDDGYEVDKIEIVDDEGDKIDAKKVEDKDDKYTFRMANCDVTVTVTFKEEGKTTEDTDKEEDKDDEETTELNFTDVKESDWFFKGVEYVVDKDIMSGVSENEFAPSGKLTRAMLVQMLYNMESRPACDAENAFMDVPVGQWYTDAVIWANDAKIVSGMGEGLFAPNMEITREQMVAMLYNYAKYKGYDVTASADLSAFADTASVSAWAQPAMQWAVAEGYISGMGDSQLAPQGTATRAEIASVIMRFMEATAETAE